MSHHCAETILAVAFVAGGGWWVGLSALMIGALAVVTWVVVSSRN